MSASLQSFTRGPHLFHRWVCPTAWLSSTGPGRFPCLVHGWILDPDPLWLRGAGSDHCKGVGAGGRQAWQGGGGLRSAFPHVTSGPTCQLPSSWPTGSLSVATLPAPPNISTSFQTSPRAGVGWGVMLVLLSQKGLPISFIEPGAPGPRQPLTSPAQRPPPPCDDGRPLHAGHRGVLLPRWIITLAYKLASVSSILKPFFTAPLSPPAPACVPLSFAANLGENAGCLPHAPGPPSSSLYPHLSQPGLGGNPPTLPPQIPSDRGTALHLSRC